PTRLLLPSRGAPPSPLELHIPTLRCVRKPERPREDRDRNEQAETCIDRDADGRLRHRGSSTWARRSGKQLLCRTSTAAEPAAEQIPAEHPVVQRRAEQRVRHGERQERTIASVDQRPRRTGDE